MSTFDSAILLGIGVLLTWFFFTFVLPSLWRVLKHVIPLGIGLVLIFAYLEGQGYSPGLNAEPNPYIVIGIVVIAVIASIFI